MRAPLLGWCWFLGSLVLGVGGCAPEGDDTADAQAQGGADGGADAAGRVGHFAGPVVVGLGYETATHSGTTGADGAFAYAEGETVRFFVGDVVLGEVPAAPSVTVFTLAGTTPPLTAEETARAGRDYYLPRPTPIAHAVHLARFLYTFDQDQDPKNGVTLGAALGPLTAGKTLDFAAPNDAFDRPFQRLVADARASGAWAAGVHTLWEGDVLRILYASLGLSAHMSVVVKNQVDQGNDGSVDSVTFTTYDAQGQRTETATDADNDGVVDSREVRTYDASGNVLESKQDANADGVFEYRATYTYDAWGQQTLTAIDSDNDGEPDTVYTITANLHGQQLTYQIDSPAGGPVESVYSSTYDARGRQTEYRYQPHTGTGWRQVFQYDAQDQQISAEMDRNDDGVFDSKTVRWYTLDDGRTLEIETDHDHDGSVDHRVRYSYDSLGTSVRITEEVDSNADEKPESVSVSQYDDDGHLVETRKDHTADGVMDYVATSTYDARGLRTRYEIDHDNDGAPEHVEVHAYDADGRPLSMEVQGGANNTWKATFTTAITAVSWWALMD